VGAYDVEIQSPDELITNLIDLNEKLACSAFNKMVKGLKNPPKTKAEIAATFRNCGLNQSADRLENNC
jgi:hypothetical protein